MPLKLYLLLLRAQSWVCLALGLNDRAMACFEAMLKLRPGLPFALASRAHVNAEAGRHADATADLQQLTRVEPEQAAHWFNLGYVLDGQGRVPALCSQCGPNQYRCIFSARTRWTGQLRSESHGCDRSEYS